MIERLAKLLKSRGLTIACAESCTGGLLTSRLTDIVGSSAYVKGSVVSYSEEVKIKLLGVDRMTIEKRGVVSVETAIEMAGGVRRLLETDIGVGITGYAGPDGEEVGLVCIAVVTADCCKSEKCRFKGDRAEIKMQASDYAVRLLLDCLQ